ncbi:class I SAM-dependent DNA methyltransferase [Hyphomonas sp. GM-8P]|uniref:HsdM family class I SAM-dependent methyltransferase n=1 Tax=Hyphomonas sp. GM-8P TaxID=1280945 RepID=UPI000DBFFDFC|nr:N-6 DNA methylase [Hyphomonas sp. GM-8P]RAN39075.1 hypothetical protein HY26_17145 [Hyphomonas sp. GM-8P]
MTLNVIAERWAADFGLALTPMFAASDTEQDGEHVILLDGNSGTFALSMTDERLWKQRLPVNWAWSSDVAHHVTMTDTEVGVVRWDAYKPEVFSRRSVEEKHHEFFNFLAADRIRSNRNVTSHFVDAYRRMRSLVADSQLPDEDSTKAFIGLLALALERAQSTKPEIAGALTTKFNQERSLLERIPESAREFLVEFLLDTEDIRADLTLIPTLAFRHAGSAIFQEAHFELLRFPSPDLFGHVGAAEAKSVSRGGSHFTPPTLARSLTEEVFRQVSDIRERRTLTILDPACGSGAFLHESLRTLERMGFSGNLRLIGRDISPSAVSMAEFVLTLAERDWAPEGGLSIDLNVGDSLSSKMPTADVVLMNPPFVAWPTMTAEQKEQMHAALGYQVSGRGDLSMAFISSAIAGLSPGGVLGTLMPNSLLNLQSAEAWRHKITSETDIAFLSSLGDYGLFSHALVQVATMVLKKPVSGNQRASSTKFLVASNSSDATSLALRQLRKSANAQHVAAFDRDYQLFQTPRETLLNQPTWRLIPPKSREALASLNSTVGLCRVNDIFTVRQGILTGHNSAFVLARSEFENLPKREQIWFRPAVMNDSISAGKINESSFVFYPYDADGLTLESEEELRKALPHYSSKWLDPNRERLEHRSSHTASGRVDWWGLTRDRHSWAATSAPRIVSKYFGAAGGFAPDFEAKYAIVQGYAWLADGLPVQSDDDISDVPLTTMLAAYVALLNSSTFLKLLDLHSPQVAGGQYNLSPRYVNLIPIPHFPSLLVDRKFGSLVLRLAELGTAPNIGVPRWQQPVDQLANELYGGVLGSLS